MNVRNCRKCGKLFNYVTGVPICPACKDALEKKFQEVKKYVQDNRGATIPDVVENCEVDAQQVRQWVREERLEFSGEGVTGITCEKCGATIPTGRFCQKCKNEMTANLNSAIPQKPKEAPKPKKDPKDNPKMRFLQ
ncbi:MAG: flagellar protein [Lachnospiraceae bacterium]|nr:flagellar protein [Lachnospiraceae bacterium]